MLRVGKKKIECLSQKHKKRTQKGKKKEKKGKKNAIFLYNFLKFLFFWKLTLVLWALQSCTQGGRIWDGGRAGQTPLPYSTTRNLKKKSNIYIYKITFFPPFCFFFFYYGIRFFPALNIAFLKKKTIILRTSEFHFLWNLRSSKLKMH